MCECVCACVRACVCVCIAWHLCLAGDGTLHQLASQNQPFGNEVLLKLSHDNMTNVRSVQVNRLLLQIEGDFITLISSEDPRAWGEVLVVWVHVMIAGVLLTQKHFSEQLMSKNHQIQCFREELDAIMATLHAVQESGGVRWQSNEH